MILLDVIEFFDYKGLLVLNKHIEIRWYTKIIQDEIYNISFNKINESMYFDFGMSNTSITLRAEAKKYLNEHGYLQFIIDYNDYIRTINQT